MNTAHEYTSRGHGLAAVLMCKHCDCLRDSKAANFGCPVLLERESRVLRRQIPHFEDEPVTQAAFNALLARAKKAEFALTTTTDLPAMTYRDNLRAALLKTVLDERVEANALLSEVSELLDGGFNNEERFALADRVSELLNKRGA